MFENIIGQEAHKLALDNMLGANRKSGSPIPPLAFVGERGAGKTKFMREVIREIGADIVLPIGDGNLDTLPEPNAIRGDNGDQVGFRSFEDHLNVALGRNGDSKAVIVFDEFHQLGKGPKYAPLTFNHLARFLMQVTILSKEGRIGTVKVGENFATWNPSNHFVIVGTNYPEQINPALASRFRTIALSSYLPEELAKILALKLHEKGLRANEDSIRPMVNVCRTSAREVDTIVGEIISIVGAQGKKTVNQDDVKIAMRQMQKYPFGFARDFVRALQTVHEKTYTTPLIESLFPSLRGGIGDELAIAWQNGLLNRSPKGWSLSEKGQRALETWKKDGFRW